MNLSLNELDTLAKRATRGAGYPWGLAEEAGKATRWLCACGLDGIGALSILLRQEFAASLDQHRPTANEAMWQATDSLCPLVSGTYLSDSANTLLDRTLEIHNVVAPLLLLPFVAKLAVRNRQHYSVQCDGSVAVTDGYGITVPAPFPDIARVVTVRPGGDIIKRNEQHSRVNVDVESLEQLNLYAGKTYAPESEQSRLLGAGAGLSDND